jgi:methylene-fatty-acyl-phospholipid synthase
MKSRYGTIQDPQYVGAMLTLLGVSSLVDWRWCAVWMAGYIFMMQVEGKEDESTRCKKRE